MLMNIESDRLVFLLLEVQLARLDIYAIWQGAQLYLIRRLNKTHAGVYHEIDKFRK